MMMMMMMMFENGDVAEWLLLYQLLVPLRWREQKASKVGSMVAPPRWQHDLLQEVLRLQSLWVETRSTPAGIPRLVPMTARKQPQRSVGGWVPSAFFGGCADGDTTQRRSSCCWKGRETCCCCSWS